jgi:hypothetical protein
MSLEAEMTEVTSGTVVALAGRRIDAPDTAPPRFPLENVAAVRQRIADLLAAERVTDLVCAAACGADLIALEEAGRLGLRRRIVLPFAAERFRETSVTDRPGDWGPVYDQMIAAVAAQGGIVVCDPVEGDDEAAYAAANHAIIREAQAQAQVQARTSGEDARRLVVIVWEGAERATTDASGELRRLALAAGFEERNVPTLD